MLVISVYKIATVYVISYLMCCSYMATSGMDRKIKIWDLRKYQCVHEFKVAAGASSLHFSSRGLLAASMGNNVCVYRVGAYVLDLLRCWWMS